MWGDQWMSAFSKAGKMWDKVLAKQDKAIRHPSSDKNDLNARRDSNAKMGYK